MPDQKPPRLSADERRTVQSLWQYHRESLVRKVEGVDEEAARRRLVGSETTLLWLVKHASGAEMRWVLLSFAGAVADVRDDAVQPEDTLQSVVADYRNTWRRVDDVVSGADFDDQCRGLSGTETVNLRWIVFHLLEETARHAGHARPPRAHRRTNRTVTPLPVRPDLAPVCGTRNQLSTAT